MDERSGGVWRGLASARTYSLVQSLLGAKEVYRQFLFRYVRPVPGERILDLGCGPGDVAELLPEVEYLGVDLSPRYIEAARRRFGGRARFLCADVTALELEETASFDAIISIGVLHHLDHDDAERMVATAARLLDRGGRFVTIDPALIAEQPSLARWLIGRDRGRYVRSPRGYQELAEPHFGSVTASVHHDLARVPYTHAVLDCREP